MTSAWWISDLTSGRNNDNDCELKVKRDAGLAQIFPKWTNRLPLYIGIVVPLAAVSIAAGVWYFGSPWYTDVGYQPVQPVPYSHKLHAGDLGLDCRYCHTTVERSAVASLPPTQTCMNCHKTILPESDKLAPVRASWESGEPIKWVRVHNLPDFAYFDHSVHIRAGVGCVSCHGNVAQMEVVRQVKPLSMSWCLDCHRDPGPNLRPVEEVTNMTWSPRDDQEEFVKDHIEKMKLSPSTDCSRCHR